VKLDPATTCVGVLDLQNDMVEPDGYFGALGAAAMAKERGILAKTRTILDATRARNMPVVYVRLGFRSDYADCLSQHPRVARFQAAKAAIIGSWGCEWPSIIQPGPDEMIITKNSTNPFFNTPLLTWLHKKRVTTFVILGISTNNVVEITARYGDDAGFSMKIVEDCCGNMKMEQHDWAIKNTLPNFAEIISSEQYLAAI
jgi:nicotinamidase-related amidase